MNYSCYNFCAALFKILGDDSNKKISFLFSAIVMAASLTGCGNTASTSPDTPSSQAVNVDAPSDSESQSDEVVEIDPFEGFEVAFCHDHEGRVVECGSSYPTHDDLTNSYQGGYEGLDKVNDLECDSYIFRDALDENIKEGDIVTYEFFLWDSSHDDIQKYVKEKYNINLTQLKKDVTVHFEEEPIEDCDPFEGMTIKFESTDIEGTPYVWYDTNLMECEGYQKAQKHDCSITYDSILPDGKDLDSLADGDTIKLIVTYHPKDEDTVYQGEEAQKKIEEYQWYRLNLTRTEYEFTIDLSQSSSNADSE